MDMKKTQHEGSAFFRAWATLVLRFRWLVLLGLAAITAYAAVLIQDRLRIDHNVEATPQRPRQRSKLPRLPKDIRTGRPDDYPHRRGCLFPCLS